MRGVTETTRASKVEWPQQQSRIWKYHATAHDLQAGKSHIGETIQFTRNYGAQPPLYRIVDVRVDRLNRLIADLVLA